MRTFHWLLFVAVALFSGSAGVAQQPPGKPSAAQQPKAKAGVTPPPTARPVAARQPFKVAMTVKDIMDAMVDPSADGVFEAVATEITPTGIVEKFPRNDAEWAKVRHSALIVMEGANLLMMRGRRVAPEKETLEAGNPKGLMIENTPMQIQALIAKDWNTWIKRATGLSDAASVALKAVDRRDREALLEAGDGLETACENCHLNYWYPSQTELLEKAEKARRTRPEFQELIDQDRRARGLPVVPARSQPKPQEPIDRLWSGLSVDGLRESFAQQLASNRAVRDFRRSGDDLFFSGPGAQGGVAKWRVHIDRAVIEPENDPKLPYRGVVNSSWYSNGQIIRTSNNGRVSNLPSELIANGLAQDCWALWDKAAGKWGWE